MEMQYAIFRNGLELHPGDHLYRIGKINGESLYVYRCPVFYCLRRSARIMAAVSNGCSNGIKPERLRQFNQVTTGWYETVTVLRHLKEDARKFCHNLGIPYHDYTVVNIHDHPLWDLRRCKGERYGFIQ